MHIINTLAKDLFEESIYLLNGPCNFQLIQAAFDGMLKTEHNVGTKKNYWSFPTYIQKTLKTEKTYSIACERSSID